MPKELQLETQVSVIRQNLECCQLEVRTPSHWQVQRLICHMQQITWVSRRPDLRLRTQSKCESLCLPLDRQNRWSGQFNRFVELIWAPKTIGSGQRSIDKSFVGVTWGSTANAQQSPQETEKGALMPKWFSALGFPGFADSPRGFSISINNATFFHQTQQRAAAALRSTPGWPSRFVKNGKDG